MVFFVLWPRTIELPHIGTVKEWPFEEVSGKTVTVGEKPKLVAFFFTSCPNVCPTTMWDLKDLSQVMQDRGISEEAYDVIAITLDPKEDTRERIRQYKEDFDITNTNWFFLRGSEEDTKKITQTFNFTYVKEPNGFITHSTSMYIIDSNNKIRSLHKMATGKSKVDLEGIADHLQQLIN